jgi:hypothetical protein
MLTGIKNHLGTTIKAYEKEMHFFSLVPNENNLEFIFFYLLSKFSYFQLVILFPSSLPLGLEMNSWERE